MQCEELNHDGTTDTTGMQLEDVIWKVSSAGAVRTAALADWFFVLLVLSVVPSWFVLLHFFGNRLVVVERSLDGLAFNHAVHGLNAGLAAAGRREGEQHGGAQNGGPASTHDGGLYWMEASATRETGRFQSSA